MKAVASETSPALPSTRLSSQFGDPNSGLRSITELSGSAVVLRIEAVISTPATKVSGNAW